MLVPGARFALFFGIAFGLQLSSGADRSELGSHPDEAAHYVTGLMLHDYFAHGLAGSPLRFAQDFYDHYPKIGLGNWPPLFYILQALWAFVFDTSPQSILLLLAVLAAALASIVFNFVKQSLGAPAATLGAVLLLLLPLVQQYSGMIMAEILSALTMFSATLFFGRFLDHEKTRDALGFGLCAALAILTKGTGGALALVAVLAILITRRFAILRKPALWWSGLLVVLLAGPWTWYFREQSRSGWLEPSPSWHFTRVAAGYYAWKLAVALGLLLGALAILGAWVVFAKKREPRGEWAACGALIIGVFIFQSIMPVGLEARHLLPALPALIAFAMAGASFCTEFLPSPVVFAAVFALFFSGIFFPPKIPIGFGSIGDHLALSPFRLPKKQFAGFAPVAARLLDDPRARVTLVASDARGEGMFISETAARDSARPSRTIQRASKILAASTWSGSGYRSLFDNADTLNQALLKARIGAIVLDNSTPNPKPHQLLLRAALEQHPERFTPLPPTPVLRDGVLQSGAICVFFVKQAL